MEQPYALDGIYYKLEYNVIINDLNKLSIKSKKRNNEIENNNLNNENYKLDFINKRQKKYK